MLGCPFTTVNKERPWEPFEVREQDTHTLRYDWFLSTDGIECEVRGAYSRPEGLVEHNRHILEARNKLFKDGD